VNALQSGDVDFMEAGPFDLLPILSKDPELKMDVLNPLGFQTFARMNFLIPPFDNPKIRRAAFLAMNQKPILKALVGDPKYYRLCGAVFGCDTPNATDVGSESLVKGNGVAEAKKLLAEAGYDGTPVVIMAPTDVGTLKTQPVVAAQLLRDVGFKVEVQATDWQTLISRRVSQKPAKEGGWNMFFSNWIGADVLNPISNVSTSGRGKSNGGWFGWSEDPELEAMRDKYARATSPEEQKKIAAEIQKEIYDKVIYIPLGEFKVPNVWRTSLSDMPRGAAIPMFWNVEKKD